jgi:hypothetical protein
VKIQIYRSFQTTLGDLGVLRGTKDLEPFISIFADGFKKGVWDPPADIDTFLKFKMDACNLYSGSYLLSHLTRIKIAHEIGLREFRLQLAYDHGETWGSPEWRSEHGHSFRICLSAKKNFGFNLDFNEPLRKLLREKDNAIEINIADNQSAARTLLTTMTETHKASRRDELQETHSADMLEIMEMLAESRNQDLSKVHPYIRPPEENILIDPPRGKPWRMSSRRFKEFVGQSRMGNELLGFLARSYYSLAERMLMERIKPSGELAIVFAYRNSSHSSVDNKYQTTPILATVEALQDQGYFVHTGSIIDIDPLTRYPFMREQRIDLAHLLDVTWGQLQQTESKKAGIVCGIWMGLDITEKIKTVLPSAGELLEAGVKHISIEIEGVYSNDTVFMHARESQLSIEDLINEKWDRANERSLSGISIATPGIGLYITLLREAGITVDLHGLGDPRGELKFYDLSRFDEVIEAGRKGYAGEPSAEVIQATASALDDRILMPVIAITRSGLGFFRWPISPSMAYVYAAQLELLAERAVRDEDHFLTQVLSKMKFNPAYLRDYAAKERDQPFTRKTREAGRWVYEMFKRLF